MEVQVLSAAPFPGRRNQVALLVRVAVVAELVDALDSGSSGGNPVEVRVLSTAPALALTH